MVRNEMKICTLRNEMGRNGMKNLYFAKRNGNISFLIVRAKRMSSTLFQHL